MKLKKIASLALAGVMAVSMLTACDTTSNDGDDNQDDNIVVPVDDSLAAAVNDELSAAVKNTLPITADSNLEAALKAVADKIDTDNLNNNKFIITSDTEDVRHLMGLDDDASLTTGMGGAGNYSNDPINQVGWDWKYFSNTATSVKTTVDLIVYDGALTEEGLAHEVAKDLKALINNDRMPNDGHSSDWTKDYDYDYTANIVSVKIDDMRGDNSHYVVALKVVQTPTEVVNVNV